MSAVVSYFRVSLMEYLRYKTQAFIWSLSDLLPTLVMFFYWVSAFNSQGSVSGIDRNHMLNYYIISGVLAVLLISHPEYVIAEDINRGRISNYLVKPFNYWLLRFIGEFTYKISRALFSVPVYAFLVLVIFKAYGVSLSLHVDMLNIGIIIGSFMITFMVKYITGLLAFFFTEVSWIVGIDELLTHFFSGLLIPLSLYPLWLERFLHYLPFKYFIYVPVLALQGAFDTKSKLATLGIEVFWIITLGLIAHILWRKGLKQYAGYGQ